MKNKEDYVGINTEIRKTTHTRLKEFIRTHKLKNASFNQGFIIDTGLVYLFDAVMMGDVDFEKLASDHIRGDD